MATNKQFIKQTTATSVTSLEVTDVFSDKYDIYYIVMDFTRSGTNQKQANLISLLDSSSTEITSGYEYAVQQMNYGSSSGSERQATSGANIVWMTYDNEGYSDLYIYNPYSSSDNTFFKGNSSGDNYGWLGIGMLDATTSCTGIKFTFNGTGQYDEIIVNVYGVK